MKNWGWGYKNLGGGANFFGLFYCSIVVDHFEKNRKYFCPPTPTKFIYPFRFLNNILIIIFLIPRKLSIAYAERGKFGLIYIVNIFLYKMSLNLYAFLLYIFFIYDNLELCRINAEHLGARWKTASFK